MMGSFIYPRTVSITRPVAQGYVGEIGYQGSEPGKETLIVQDIAASIQAAGRSPNRIGLPGDSAKTYWQIILPPAALALGTVQTRDIVTDDHGVRYQVQNPYWNSLGYSMLVERLEV